VTASLVPIFADDDTGFNVTPEGYAMRPDEDTVVREVKMEIPA
jgi:hypothetical protein